MSAQLRCGVEGDARPCTACKRMAKNWMTYTAHKGAEPERFCAPCFHEVLSELRERGGVSKEDSLRTLFATIDDLDKRVIGLTEALRSTMKDLATKQREADEAKAAVRAMMRERGTT